ncbi:GAF domain-containing protein [Rhizobium sp. S163]|uniref:hybrid sensor histidine kinase/response regulator n=1 Tax=Rhizobium sp. S163 TaxID=3055039 RepID=UPI0025A9E613|nr:GAF domain-containing protein [Rhizobium sp. S163]MDM9649133.1 GAF domain-containing protein [Rhizobium sp. S163]
MQDVALETILNDLVGMVESFSSSDIVASVLLAEEDGKRLRHGAGPNLPAEYNNAIDGIEIGPAVGSCGTAAFRKEPVYVHDIATDPLWVDFRELALAHGLRACWSAPILSSDGAVLGTFAIYYKQALSASSSDQEMLGFVAGTAALVIERRRAQEVLRRQAERLEGLNKTAGLLAGELDLDQLVQTVTDSGVELAGAKFGAFFYNVEDDKGESYMLYTLSGVPRSEFSKFPMPRNTRVFAPTFEGKGVVRSDDIMADERYGHNEPHKGMPAGHLPVRSYLAVPVVAANGSVVGGLFFGHPETRRFTTDHEALVQAIARQAAVAFENARLFKTAQKEIEQRKFAEEQLNKLNGQLQEMIDEAVERAGVAEQALRQSQKMEAIGQLTGGIAHDFNNLLQVVSGNLQLLGRDIIENPSAQKKVANALEGVARGSKLASQLLSFGRRQALEPKVVNVGRFVAGMEDMLRRTLGEAIEIEIVRSGGLWNTFVDVVQVENAILNLAINARDAMEGMGKLTIEVGNAFLDDVYALQHDEVEAGQYVMLALTDTGSGMSPEIIAKVFDPFFTTKPVGKGTGLGLSMVHGFVKQSGGHVKIYSEIGEGSSVKLYFPRSHQHEDAVVAADTGPVVGGTETILVAEDDEKVRETVVAMLTDLGYRVLKAKDASAALTVVESGIPIDLLFTDVVMPGPLKSSEMARQARERMPDLGVLFTSGYTENSIVHGGKLDVGVELLSKPYTREALARKIRHVLNNSKQVKAARERQEAIAELTVGTDGPDEDTVALTAISRETGHQRRVLVVEDNELIRMSEADMLIELGCEVSEAASAEEAFPLLEAGEVDILVSDLGLPGMSGEDFCREVRRRWPRIGIVFATGRDTGPILDDHARTALLSKPHGLEELASALDKVDTQ